MLVFPSHVLYYPWFPGNILSQRNRKWTCVPKDFFSRSPPLSQNLWPKASWGDNSRGERDSQKKIFKALFPLKSTHCGWRSIKLSHFQTFEFSCLKSTIKSITFKKRNIQKSIHTKIFTNFVREVKIQYSDSCCKIDDFSRDNVKKDK